MSLSYPERLEIQPLAKPPHATIRVPGSKSITNRALVLAALASDDIKGRYLNEGCWLNGVLQSEDTEVMAEALKQLGFPLRIDWKKQDAFIEPRNPNRVIPASSANLFLANSGTSMRFLTALVALGEGRYRLDGIARMRERPIQDLLESLQQLGVKANAECNNGCPPVIIEANGLRGGDIHVRADTSSQFLSGLLMAAPFAQKDTTIQVDGSMVSQPYVRMTVAMMRQFGLIVDDEGLTYFHIPAPQRGTLFRDCGFFYYSIEPDASAASYFMAAAAVTGGRVLIPGLYQGSLQGDIQFACILAKMGCQITWEFGPDTVVRGAPLRGIDVDMNDISDTVMTLAAVACFAEGQTTIRNVAHIRHKETDRIAALATELRRVGAEVEEYPDGLKITPRPLHGALIETYNDHRMAMSMALIGLKVPGIVIKNPGCVAKTYPSFWEDLEKLRTVRSQ
jgi:3-phosphoshikimate 1-carboxyvinyltransferase